MVVAGTIAVAPLTADLFVGLLIGVCVGLLVGPAFRSWLVFRERVEATREADLTDELISRFDRDLEERLHADDRMELWETWRTSP
jgi:hypothetical protein